MVIFSHRGIGFGKRENSIAAFESALSGGFSIEADIRLKDGKAVLSHDEVGVSSVVEGLDELLPLALKFPGSFFALHLKEDSSTLFELAAASVKSLRNCFLFVTDFPQGKFINKLYLMLGQHQLALYVNKKKLDLDMLKMVDYLWLDETEEAIFEDLDHFSAMGKKVIACSPELFMPEHKERLIFLRSKASKSAIFGICTDLIGTHKAQAL